jgi:prophage regulatory protein
MRTTTEENAASATVLQLNDARARKDKAIQRYFFPLKQVEKITGIRKSAIYAGMAAGTFPKNLRLPHSRSVAWLSTDIDAWMDAVIAANTGGPEAAQ